MAALLVTTASSATAQTPVPTTPTTPTLWRFIGIPQGLQKIRDVTVNRRGNFPGLERKPAIKRIGDPANLESDNPAIKTAAEIKQAEDLKDQKIKAIKFLAKMGCGCYDKDGKITDALIAAMDDCTPDVRLAAIEAIEETANGECCTKCGSTSCCSEKVTKRLSEIAYERDDTGCCLEPSAEIREAAAKALCVCCPNRATGPIEEDIPELDEPEVVPTPDKPKEIDGEGGTKQSKAIEGEGGEEDGGEEEAELDSDATEESLEDAVEDAVDQLESGSDSAAKPLMRTNEVLRLRSAESSLPQPIEVPAPAVAAPVKRSDVEIGEVTVIGGMTIRPVTISTVAATEEEFVAPASSSTAQAVSQQDQQAVSISLKDLPQSPAALPAPIALPIQASPASAERPMPTTAPQAKMESVPSSRPVAKPVPTGRKQKAEAKIVGVDYRTGRVVLRSGQPLRAGASVTVYHRYLTGERLVAHLLIKQVDGAQAIAVATDKEGLGKIEAGDRAICF